MALQSQITGLVLDHKNNNPIANVNIKSDSIGTSTDTLGKFFIDIPEGRQLEFSHIGYEKKVVLGYDGLEVKLFQDILKWHQITVKSNFSEEDYGESVASINIFENQEIKESNANHLEYLTNRISNFNWSGGTSRPRYFQIRGLGGNSHYFGEGPPNFSVGFVFDDIDLSGMGMLGNTFDIEQIEIHKGPQSSVFGSNAIAGLISLRSRPITDNFESGFSVSLGDDSHKSVKGFQNIKISNFLKLRYIFDYNYRGGFRKNLSRGMIDSNRKKELFSRLKVEFHPIEQIKILGTHINANLDNRYDVWSPDNNEQFETYTDSLGEDSQKTKGFSLRSKIKISEDFNLLFIATRSNTQLVHAYDGDWANDSYWLDEHHFDPDSTGYSYSFYEKNKRVRYNSSQELRMNFKNLVTGFYFKNLSEQDDAIGYLFGGLGDKADGKYDFKAYAGYFQVYHNVAKKLKLMFNYRLENNIYKYIGNTYDNYYNDNVPLVNYESENIMMGYKGSFLYGISKNSNSYFSYAKGFKAGGVNQEPNLTESERIFEPEYLINFEIGIKTIKNNFGYAINAFFGNRKNQQVTLSKQRNVGDPNSFYFYTANSTSGYISGLEMDLNYILGSNFTFQSTFGILDTYVESFEYEITENVRTTGGNRESAMAPKYSGSFGLKFEKTDYYFLTNTSYKSEYYYSDSHKKRSKPYTLTNITIGREIKDFSLNLWVRNIFNEKYTIRGFYFGLIPEDYPNQLFESYGSPRHFGITLNYGL